jgi:glycosyltransferase involved in cell wall biosynthesis
MEPSNELVSIIIPAYNAATTIRKAIESVLNQTYRNCEIIVVDDGSTDNTKEVLNDFICKQKIIYLYQKNAGCGAARNNGVNHSHGGYLAFLDADDYFHVEKIERQIMVFQKHPKCVVCYTDSYEIDPYQKLIWTVRQTTAGKLHRGNILGYLVMRNFITLSSGLVKRDAFEKVGGFEERYDLMMFADYDLWLKLATKGDFEPIEIPLVFYQTRIEITRKQKRDNHKKVMKVFSNCFYKSAGQYKFWYGLGYILSMLKYSYHSALLIVHV